MNISRSVPHTYSHTSLLSLFASAKIKGCQPFYGNSIEINDEVWLVDAEIEDIVDSIAYTVAYQVLYGWYSV